MYSHLRKIGLLTSSFGLLIALLLFSPLSTYAQEVSLSLGYAPTAIYLDLQPGDQYEGEVTYWNLAPRTIDFSVQVGGFSQIENFPGTSRILTEQEEANDPFSAASWFFVGQDILTIAPNSSEKVTYTVTVPENSASGEHHASIFLLSADDARGNTPGSQALTDLGSGPAILINVGDEIIENAQLISFETDKGFYEKTPVNFFTEYKNAGNTHITPAGDIVLENFLGQEVDRIIFNENRQSVLRGNLATYEDVWQFDSLFLRNSKLAIGPIKAKLITTYKSENPGFSPLSATTTFWVLPWKHILVTIIVLGYLYNRTVASKSRKNKRSEDINRYSAPATAS